MFKNRFKGDYLFVALITFISVNTTLLLIYERNTTQYILYGVSIILIVLGYLMGQIEGMVASIFGVFALGTYMLYAIIVLKTMRTLDFSMIRWFLIFPLGAVIGGKYGEVTKEIFQKIKKYDRDMNEMVSIDELTGFNNEKRFFVDLEQEVNRAKRYKTNLTVLVMQIAYFDRLEAIYGKTVCNMAVKAIAERIEQLLRVSDKKARIRSDEFAIILTNTDIEGAERVREKLKELLEEVVLQGDRTGKKLNFSYKIGITEMGMEDDIFSLMKRAEGELQYDV
ncbi:MAG: GGDEF domain-containing protein [Clostridia bacterium]|nr:GGDEF domain-containing protein [Clostridia bacterium]